MNRHRYTISMLAASMILAASIAASGQPESKAQVEPSCDVTLHLIIGSNDTSQRNELPANLAAISPQLRGAMPFPNYRLASTFFGRVLNSGNFEYKSISNIFGESSDLRSQTFLEWSLVNLKELPTAQGARGFQAVNFRFGARVPVMTGSMLKDEAGKATPVVNYESIGLTLRGVGLAENVPTMIGTLNLPGANDTIFLVMTVKGVDM